MAKQDPAASADTTTPKPKSRVGAAAKKAAEKASDAASRARKALRESKHRRSIEAGEVVLGAVAAGAAHGADLVYELDEDTKIPGGLIGGVLLLGVGVAMDEPDLQALGLGAASFGAGRMVEDYTRDMLKEDSK